MTAAFTLPPGSPEARAVCQLLAEERIVRLDPVSPDPLASAAAVVRQLLGLVQWENEHASRSIHFLVNDRKLKPRVAHRLVGMLAGPTDPVGDIRFDGDLLGRPHPVLHNQHIDVAPPTAQRNGDLFIAGFEPHPWRNLTSDMFARRWTKANQVLVVGPDLPWKEPYFTGLLNKHPAKYEVWAPLTMEILIAGAA